MDPSFSNDDGCELVLPRIEIPKWFNHQSVQNSLSFQVGREFQKLIVCFTFRLVEVEATKATFFVVSANGFSKEYLSSYFIEGGSVSVQVGREWNVSNPSEQNHVTITVEIKYYPQIISSSYDEPKITWLGVHVDCICCPQNIAHFTHHPSGYGFSSVPNNIDDHSFRFDEGLQMGTINGFDLHLGHPGLGFTYGLDDLGSSSMDWVCDNTELQPLPAVFSTSYGTDLDHGVLNSGGVSGLLIEPNSGLTGSYLGFESTFHGDVHNLDSSSFSYPFASIGYHDSNSSRDGCPPLVLDDIKHLSLPSDMFDSYLGLDLTIHGNGCHLGLTSIANPFLSTGCNDSDVGEHWPPSIPEDTIHHSLPSDLLPMAGCDGFDLGSSSMVYAFDNNDSDFNQFPPSKKARTS